METDQIKPAWVRVGRPPVDPHAAGKDIRIPVSPELKRAAKAAAYHANMEFAAFVRLAIAEKIGQPMLAQTRKKGRPRHPLIPQTIIETVIPAPRTEGDE